jgi:hypothetical protein
LLVAALVEPLAVIQTLHLLSHDDVQKAYESVSLRLALLARERELTLQLLEEEKLAVVVEREQLEAVMPSQAAIPVQTRKVKQ